MIKGLKVRDESSFGEVYVIVVASDTSFETLQVVEVYDSEAVAFERKDRLEREGYRSVHIKRCGIKT